MDGTQSAVVCSVLSVGLAVNNLTETKRKPHNEDTKSLQQKMSSLTQRNVRHTANSCGEATGKQELLQELFCTSSAGRIPTDTA